MGDNKSSESADAAEAGRGSLVAPLYLLQECLSSAVVSIRSHGLRSFLTRLGIIIGVSSMILVVALMQGLASSITQQLDALGSRTLTLRPQTSLEEQMRGKTNRLRAADLDEIEVRIEGITNVTPFVFAGQRFGSEVVYGPNRAYGQFYGTTQSYQDVFQVFPVSGRFLAPSDETTRRRVVVLGEQLRKDLKLPKDPTGKFVQIGTEWFKVVGLMEARGEIFGQSQDNYLLMPYSTALSVTGVISDPDLWISFTVADADEVESVREKVITLMRQLHRIEGDEEEDFAVDSSATIAKTVKNVSLAMTLIVAGIVGISSIVGGVGIMNIMLVSVTERTREIGIAKALGAPRRFVLVQFLVEAMVLAMIGGIIGILLGLLFAYAAFQIISGVMASFPAPEIPWWAVVGSFTFSALIGVIFGILPAHKAANLQPIEALRYE